MTIPKVCVTIYYNDEVNMSKSRQLRLEEVASRLGISYFATRDLIKEGKISSITVGARGVRVDEEALEKYLKSLRVGKATDLAQNTTREG